MYNIITGSCSAAGYSSCCVSGPCKGEPPYCYCDSLCRVFKDCCPDANTVCQTNNITSGSMHAESDDHSISLIRTQAHARMSGKYYSSNINNMMCMIHDLLHTGHTILSFITRPHNLTTSQSRRVEFQCSVRSTLIPTFMWNFTRKGASEAETIASKRGLLSADYSITAGQRSQALIITNVQWRHEGEYKCIVSSESSQIQAEANLNVPSECFLNNF